MAQAWKWKTFDDSFQLQGEFWIAGFEEHRRSGTVSYDDGIELTVRDSLERTSDPIGGFREALEDALGDESEDTSSAIDVIHGKLDCGVDCTLYRSFQISQNSERVIYFCNLLLLGKHLRSFESEVYVSATCKSSNLEVWIGHSGPKSGSWIKRDDGRACKKHCVSWQNLVLAATSVSRTGEKDAWTLPYEPERNS